MSIEGWEKTKISQLGEIVTGSTPDTQNSDYWGGDIPFVSPSDFNSSAFILKTDKTLTRQGAKQARNISKDSILVTCIGSIGGIAIAPWECVTNQQINSVICREKFDAFFVYFLIKNNLFKLQKLAGTTTLPIINKSTFGNIEIVCPKSKKEQEKIAEVLSTIDRAIAQTEAIIAKQQRIKTGLMQDLLTKGIDENGNIRSEATHKFKDSAIGRIPVEWKVVATGEVTNSLVPGRDKPDLDGGGIPWITIPDIDAMYICASKNGFSLSQKAIKLANARLMPRGTVLMSCVGEFGITTITEVEVIANQQLHGFICGDDILPEWLAIQINASGTRIDTLTTQTTIKYLNKTGCESILIALPNIDEQKRAISIFGNSLRFIATQEKHLAKLQHQKTGLMQGLLTGKVRVTNLLKEREPTSP